MDDLDVAGDFSSGSFSSLKSFAVSFRNILLHETGLVLLKGLDLEMFGSVDSKEIVACSKIAYYLLCEHIGTVDGSARGRLFDVMDNNINAKGPKSDNILFAGTPPLNSSLFSNPSHVGTDCYSSSFCFTFSI